MYWYLAYKIYVSICSVHAIYAGICSAPLAWGLSYDIDKLGSYFRWKSIRSETIAGFSLTYIPGQGMNRTLMEVSILDHSRYRGRVEET
jgi:hypothetical protein